jgi:hypothetical protein
MPNHSYLSPEGEAHLRKQLAELKTLQFVFTDEEALAILEALKFTANQQELLRHKSDPVFRSLIATFADRLSLVL